MSAPEQEHVDGSVSSDEEDAPPLLVDTAQQQQTSQPGLDEVVQARVPITIVTGEYRIILENVAVYTNNV